MPKALTGKVAVVTGSTQGLGAAIATLFVKQGAKVVLSGLSATNGKRARAEARAERRVTTQTDLSRVEDCGRLIRRPAMNASRRSTS